MSDFPQTWSTCRFGDAVDYGLRMKARRVTMNCPNRRCWRVRQWTNLKALYWNCERFWMDLGEEIDEVGA